MTRVCCFLALVWLSCVVPARAFNWETATARGRDYVTLRSLCAFYNFGYAAPGGNTVVSARSPNHLLTLKMGSPDMWLDGVHYVMSFPVEFGSGDWLVSRMDVIKLFEPILRPQEIAGRHPIRGVVIDAGHGGTDNGATSRLGAEKNYTIDTAYRLQAILNNAGIPTVLTRRNDVFVDLYERAHIASLYPDYAFVSIHFNSASEEARGLETYCLSPRGAASTSSSYLTRADIQELPGNEDDAVNILLASAVHSEIIRLNPGDMSMDRGVKRARFVVIKANTLPAILVEGGFVSNRMESARVNSAGYRQALAQGIARGLIKFSNIMGNRHTLLPGLFQSAPAPPPLAIAPRPAPAGLATELPPGTIASDGNHSGAHLTGKKSKKKKGARVAAQAAALSSTPGSSGTTGAPASNESSSNNSSAFSKNGSPLGLAEPAPPKISAAEADKAPPEPDEPPTVNTGEPTPAKGGGASSPGSREP